MMKLDQDHHVCIYWIDPTCHDTPCVMHCCLTNYHNRLSINELQPIGNFDFILGNASRKQERDVTAPL